jgi:hypothetical protein
MSLKRTTMIFWFSGSFLGNSCQKLVYKWDQDFSLVWLFFLYLGFHIALYDIYEHINEYMPDTRILVLPYTHTHKYIHTHTHTHTQKHTHIFPTRKNILQNWEMLEIYWWTCSNSVKKGKGKPDILYQFIYSHDKIILPVSFSHLSKVGMELSTVVTSEMKEVERGDFTVLYYISSISQVNIPTIVNCFIINSGLV